MDAIIVERENRVKSGVSTTFIVIGMTLILWLYKVSIEIPVPFPEPAEVEMMITTLAGGDDGQGSPNETSVPIETPETETPASVEETQDEPAPKQEKTPEVVPEKPDNSVDNMRHNREKARQEAEREKAKHSNGKVDGDVNGQWKSDGDDEKGPVADTEKVDKIGVSSTFSGRSFKGGNTSTDCHQAGKVVLEVQILPNGKIIFIDVDPASNGSDCLVKAAKEILRNSSFNVSAKPASNGTITFIFNLN